MKLIEVLPRYFRAFSKPYNVSRHAYLINKKRTEEEDLEFRILATELALNAVVCKLVRRTGTPLNQVILKQTYKETAAILFYIQQLRELYRMQDYLDKQLEAA